MKIVDRQHAAYTQQKRGDPGHTVPWSSDVLNRYNICVHSAGSRRARVLLPGMVSRTAGFAVAFHIPTEDDLTS